VQRARLGVSLELGSLGELGDGWNMRLNHRYIASIEKYFRTRACVLAV
jgi:hypothetical protein